MRTVAGSMITRPAWIVLAAVLFAVFAAAPFFVSDAIVHYGIDFLVLATLAQSWNVIGGFAGYPSFGNSVFYGLGTYGVAIAMAQIPWPPGFPTGAEFGLGLVLGVVLAVACAVILGGPILRLRGPYFAIATLGLNGAMLALVSNLDIAGRNNGLILPLTRADQWFYWGLLLLLLAATVAVAAIANSRFGAGLIAIREDEDAAAATGINTTLYKVLALVISSVFTAVAGGIYAYNVTFIDPGSAFDATLNVRMVIMAYFGGPGTVLGPVLGALILSAVYNVLAIRISTAAALLFGLVIILSVVYMPRGLLDVVVGIRRRGLSYFLQNIRQHRL